MSSKWHEKKWITVLLHTCLWILLFSLPYILRPSLNEGRPATEHKEPAIVHIRYILNDLVYITFFYLNASVLIAQFIYKRKYKQYTAIIIACFVVILFITWLLFSEMMSQQNFSLSKHFFV